MDRMDIGIIALAILFAFALLRDEIRQRLPKTKYSDKLRYDHRKIDWTDSKGAVAFAAGMDSDIVQMLQNQKKPSSHAGR